MLVDSGGEVGLGLKEGGGEREGRLGKGWRREGCGGVPVVGVDGGGDEEGGHGYGGELRFGALVRISDSVVSGLVWNREHQ